MPVNSSHTAEMPARCVAGPGWSGALKTALLGIASTTMTWRRRARTRAQLRDLEPHLLDDIGLSREQRDREARKPFWVR